MMIAMQSTRLEHVHREREEEEKSGHAKAEAIRAA